MYGRQAAAAYGAVDASAKVAGADRHGLIQLLFDEFGVSLARAESACTRGDRTARSQAASKALSILAALSSSLDTERGGEVAALLGTVYARASSDLIAAAKTEDAEDYRRIALRVADIASAWRLIGERR